MASDAALAICQRCQGDAQEFTQSRLASYAWLGDVLEPAFTSVLQARSRDEFQKEIVRFTERLGFQAVSAMVVIDHHLGQPEFITVESMPRGYRDSFSNVENGRRDPVMQHCKHRNMPIIWDQAVYAERGMGPKWEEQARFGIRNGVAMALHMPEGRHFFLGVARDQPVQDDSLTMTRLVAYLQLFAVHAQDAAVRILTPALVAPGTPSLTPRELETLRWTMEGKTAWEVGMIMNISEGTAIKHLRNSMLKLNCVNKTQAALKAMRFGLIRF